MNRKAASQRELFDRECAHIVAAGQLEVKGPWRDTTSPVISFASLTFGLQGTGLVRKPRVDRDGFDTDWWCVRLMCIVVGSSVMYDESHSRKGIVRLLHITIAALHNFNTCRPSINRLTDKR